MASILLGDYNDNPGSAQESSIEPPNPPVNWRDLSSGFAQEAEAQYYFVGGDELDKVAGFNCSIGAGIAECDPMDIVHSANPIDSANCDAASQLTIESVVEEVFEAGTLPVIITHNDNRFYTGTDACAVRSPADIPKALAVGALEPDDSSAYNTWTYAGYSNRGGGPIKIGNGTTSNNMIVDLVASGFPGFVTDETGTYGRVDPDGPCIDNGQQAPVGDPGTSYSGPQVAGAAAVLKHYALDQGWSWIENPGRLHTMMLAMGDRASTIANGAALAPCVFGSGSSARIRCGADKYYGLGRLHLNIPDAQSHFTKTFTNPTGSMHKRLFNGTPMAADVVMVKCVMQQFEDMSEKDDMSRVELTLSVHDQQAGACVKGAGEVFSRNDDANDDKHMVTIVDSEFDLNNRCLEMRMDVRTLSTQDSVTAHVFCYYDTALDY